MRVVPYTDVSDAEWRQFVLAHPDRSIGHLPEMAAFERLTSGADNRSLAVRDEAGKVVGVAPLFRIEARELRALATRTLTSGTHVPSGPLLAAALSVKQHATMTGLLVDRMLQDARALKADAISIAYPTIVRARPAVESLGLYPLRAHGFRETNVVALVSDLSAPEDTLLAGLDAKARNLIKRCRAGGAEVRQIVRREDWMAAVELNRMTLGDAALSVEAMESFWTLFLEPRHAAATGVYFDGRLASVVSTTLVGAAGYYWLSFNSVPPPVPGANSLALWEAMLIAKRAGATMFELGSLEFDDPKQIRIGRFKSQFGGRPVYALAGVRQLRPWRRAALDFVGQTLRAVRRRRAASDAPDAEPGSPPDERAPAR